MRNYRLPMLVAILVIGGEVALAVTGAKTYVNPKLEAGSASIKKVCVIPGQAEMSRVGMKGREGMAKESEAWGAELQRVVENHLGNAGVEVVPSGLSQQELEKNQELQQTLLQVQQRYDSVSVQLDKKAKDVKKERFTLGDEVALLPCAANADALVFVQGQGNVLTGGKKAFGMLIAGPSRSTGFLKISFVDAKSGDVLAVIHMLNTGKFETDSEKAYGDKLDKQFKKMKIGHSSTGHE